MEIKTIIVTLVLKESTYPAYPKYDSYHIEEFSSGLHTTVPAYRNTTSWKADDFTPTQILMDLMYRYKKDRHLVHAYILRPLRDHARVEWVSENIVKVSAEMYVTQAELGKL